MLQAQKIKFHCTFSACRYGAQKGARTAAVLEVGGWRESCVERFPASHWRPHHGSHQLVHKAGSTSVLSLEWLDSNPTIQVWEDWGRRWLREFEDCCDCCSGFPKFSCGHAPLLATTREREKERERAYRASKRDSECMLRLQTVALSAQKHQLCWKKWRSHLAAAMNLHARSKPACTCLQGATWLLRSTLWGKAHYLQAMLLLSRKISFWPWPRRKDRTSASGCHKVRDSS